MCLCTCAQEDFPDANPPIDDEICVRFLRARDLDLGKSDKMLRDKLKWEGEMKPYAVTPAEIEPSLKSGCWSFLPGRAKDGGVIISVQVGLWNPHEYDIAQYTRMVGTVKLTLPDQWMCECGEANTNPAIHQCCAALARCPTSSAQRRRCARQTRRTGQATHPTHPTAPQPLVQATPHTPHTPHTPQPHSR